MDHTEQIDWSSLNLYNQKGELIRKGNRKISTEEIKKACEHYLYRTKPIIDKMVEMSSILKPALIKTDVGVKFTYDHYPAYYMLKKEIEKIEQQISHDLENGKFR